MLSAPDKWSGVIEVVNRPAAPAPLVSLKGVGGVVVVVVVVGGFW